MAKPKTPRTNGTVKSNPGSEASVQASSPEIESAALPTQKPRKITKKARSEFRANLVPINLEDEIRSLAYLMSERRGFEPGHETEDWLAAEHEVMQRYHQHSA